MRLSPSSLLLLLSGLGFSFLSMRLPDGPAPDSIVYNPCKDNPKALASGEELTYELFYNWNFVWVSAGLVTFTVEETPNYYHIAVRGRTHDSYDWFYKVRDRYDTWVDKKTLLPVMFVRDTDEGGYTVYDKVEFNQQDKRAKSTKGRDKATAQSQSVKLSSCMHDIISVIYYARSLDYSQMKEGQKIPMQVYLDREIYPLNVTYKGRDKKVKIKDQGTFKAIKFSPEVIAGKVFDEDTQVKVWATDDLNRVPILIESPISVGSVKAVLKSYKGLQYPLSSKLK